MSFIVNTSSGGYLVGGSGIAYGLAPNVIVNRPVSGIAYRVRPNVLVNRSVACVPARVRVEVQRNVCCFCDSPTHRGRDCPLYLLGRR